MFYNDNDNNIGNSSNIGNNNDNNIGGSSNKISPNIVNKHLQANKAERFGRLDELRNS